MYFGSLDIYFSTGFIIYLKFSVFGVAYVSDVCDVDGCNEPAVRSIAINKVREAGLTVRPKGRRVLLCRQHYKEFKKRRKKLDRLERLRWKNV